MEKSERRAAKRLDLQLTGTVTFNIEGRKLKKTVTTKDISEHGAYLLTDTCPRVGDRIILRLQQRGSDPNQSGIALEAVATVLRVDQLSEKTGGFAVKFEETLMRSFYLIPNMTKEKHGEKAERRKFKRWTVSIPCSVEWDDTIIEGIIDNLSYGGACITEMKVTPVEGTLVTVKFQLEEEASKLVVTARVVYTVREIREGEATHGLGVEFQEPLENVSTQLTRLFLRLRRNELENC